MIVGARTHACVYERNRQIDMVRARTRGDYILTIDQDERERGHVCSLEWTDVRQGKMTETHLRVGNDLDERGGREPY